MRSDSWKRIEDFGMGYCPMPASGKLVNGKLHWLGRNDSGGWEFVGLDLAKEEYEIVGRPQHFSSYDHWSWHMLNLGGYLGMLCTGGGSRWDVDVWVMMNYGEAESWTKIWKQSEYGLNPGLGVGMPIWFRENGDIAVSIGEWVEVYNVKNKSLKSRVYVPDGNLRGIKCYVESLVSPFGNEEELGR